MKHSEQSMLANSISLAAISHLGQYDKGGKPYILHCLHVMNTVKSSDPEVKQIAVLHDLMEDHPFWTPEKLLADGYSERVVTALNLLNHNKKTTSYWDYIAGIATNRDAILVKMADLRHNSLITRLQDRASQEDGERTVKYQTCYVFLKEELMKMKTPDQLRIEELEKQVSDFEEADEQRYFDDITQAERDGINE